MLRKNRSFYGIVVFFCLLLGLTLGQTSIASQTGLEMDSAPISLDVRQMSLPDVLRLIADKANINIIFGREVTEADIVITLRLKNVDIWQALEAVLETNGFTYREEEGIIRVVKAKELGEVKTPLLETEIIFLKSAEEAEDVRKAFQHLLSASGTMEIDVTSKALIITDIPEDIENIKKRVAELEEAREKIEKEKVEEKRIEEIIENLQKKVAKLEEAAREKIEEEPPPPPVLEQFQLNYINVEGKMDVLTKALDNIIKEEGTFFIDSLTNSVYVEAPSSYINEVKEYFEGADVSPKRIMIKAEFVEVRLTAEEELGIKWRWKGAYDNYPLGATFRYPHQTRSESGESAADPGLSTLAAGMGIIFGSIGQEFRGMIDLLISEGKANLLSSPNIVTLENREAKIDVGDEYPYETYVIEQGVKVPTIKFKTVGAILLVTPYIEGKERVVLDIESEVSEITGAPPFPAAPPIVGTRKARTQIAVNTGETIVIGGLLRETEKETREGIPFLSRIPIIGSLFTFKTSKKEKTDLLIFITPYILSERLEEESIVEKGKPLKVQIEELYQKGLDYKKNREYEKARECFERVANESRAYGFSDYLKTAEKELANLDELDELEKNRLELEKKKEAEKLEKVRELELKEKRIDKVKTEVKKVRKESIFGIGLGQWFSSMNGDSFMTYEAQLLLKGNVRLFSGGGRTSDQSSSVTYFGAQIGDKLNIGIGGIQSGTSEKVNLMLTTGFSLGTERLRLEGSYLYVPGEEGSSGTKVMLAIAF